MERIIKGFLVKVIMTNKRRKFWINLAKEKGMSSEDIKLVSRMPDPSLVVCTHGLKKYDFKGNIIYEKINRFKKLE